MYATFEHIETLERSLLSADVRSSPKKLDRLLSDRFIEIGQSGRLYNKADIMGELSGAPQSNAQFFDFDLRTLSPTLILAGYTSTNNGKTVRRHSLWERTGTTWQILYHEAEQTHG